MAFDVGAFDFNAYGSGGSNHHGFGFKDLQAAQSMGASRYQIYQLREKARRIGAPEGSQMAGNFANLGPAPKSPWNYGAHGGWGFGLKDVDAMGNDLEKVRGARDWAQQHGLNIGEGVNTRIQELDAAARDKRHFEQQQQLAAEQAERDRLAREAQEKFQADLLAQQQAAAAEQARIQEAAAAQAARVKGSGSTGVGTAATIKGSRLSITEAGGRKGTNRFSRPTPYQYMNTMGISGSQTGKSNLNL